MFRNVGLKKYYKEIIRVNYRLLNESSQKLINKQCFEYVQVQNNVNLIPQIVNNNNDDDGNILKFYTNSKTKQENHFKKFHHHPPPLTSIIHNKNFLEVRKPLTCVKYYTTENKLTTNKDPKKNKLLPWLLSLFKYKNKTKINLIKEPKKIDKNEIFENASSKEESEKIKMAFTDGYMAASRQILEPKPTSKFMKVFTPILTIFFISGFLICLIIIVSGSVFRTQMSKYLEVNPEEIHVTFRDVKGAEEAKQELKEIVAFLRNPEKFSILGGKLPKGVLLVGPPGTGKTLLARAVAGEAKVPFFHAAGPEFDEVLVGQGARRVRDLFKAAKEVAPCVIFIDEIDSVGSKRTNSTLHPYANQTINQLLSEMDGFHQNEGVIVLGATNRRNDLDKALLRPGRFDVEVMVPIPDYTERKEIIEYYLSKILYKDINLELLARGTVGFTGADLENMVNQAALRAAIEGADSVTMAYLESAKDKILMGPERKSRMPDSETNLITAYHESGHTIVCYYTKDSKPIHKVTILPRGRSLGHTAYIPEKEQYLVKKSELLATMDTLMGGRAAEEIIFGPDKITTGASNDLKEATSIATHMVKEWGMSESVGLRTVEENQRSSEAIDAEISWLLQESYKRAKTIIKNYSRELKLLVEALLKYETLDADDVKAILMERRKN